MMSRCDVGLVQRQRLVVPKRSFLFERKLFRTAQKKSYDWQNYD